MAERHIEEIEAAAKDHSLAEHSLASIELARLKKLDDYSKTVDIQEKLANGVLLDDGDLAFLGMSLDAEEEYRKFRATVLSTTMDNDLDRITEVIKGRTEELRQQAVEEVREEIMLSFEQDIMPLLEKLDDLGGRWGYIIAVIFDEEAHPFPEYFLESLYNSSPSYTDAGKPAGPHSGDSKDRNDFYSSISKRKLRQLIRNSFAEKGAEGLTDYQTWSAFAQIALNEEINRHIAKLAA